MIDNAQALNSIAAHLEPLGSFSPEESVFLTVYRLEAIARDEGFDGYFITSAGDRANEVVEALQAIDAHGAAEIVREALRLVYGDHVPEDRLERKRIWEGLPPDDYETLGNHDDAYWAYPDNLIEKMYQYVVAHASNIRGAEAILNGEPSPEAPASLLDRIKSIFGG